MFHFLKKKTYSRIMNVIDGENAAKASFHTKELITR